MPPPFVHTHEWSDGYTLTITSSDRRTGSPPATGRSCPSGTPCSAITRTVSYEPTIVAPVFARDALRAPQVIEVRVADEDPVGALDVVGGEPRAGRAGRAVDVGVEEDDECRPP